MSDLPLAVTQDLDRDFSLLAFECLARLAVAGIAGVLSLRRVFLVAEQYPASRKVTIYGFRSQRDTPLKKRQVGMNLPLLVVQSFWGLGSARRDRTTRKVKAAYLKLTVVLKCLPSRSITSSSRQVPAQALLVFQK